MSTSRPGAGSPTSPPEPERPAATPEPAIGGVLRRVALFVVIASAVYLSLVIAWPFVGASYGAAYRAGARTLLGQFDGDLVEFRPSTEQANMDTEIRANRKHVRLGGRCFHSTRVIGYLTTAELVALILATPASFRRKAVGLAIGLFAAHAYIVLRLVVILLWLYSTPEAPFAKYDFGTTGRYMLTWLTLTVATSLNGTFFGPVAIWAIVMFRADELRALVGRGPRRATAA